MSTETEIKSALVAKQRILGENENETSFTTWQQSIMFNLVVDNKFSRFTDAADLGIWGPSTAQHRGYQNDSDPVPENLRMTAAQKAAILKVLLGCISTFAPVISNKFITEQSTSLDSIFDRLRGHYGIRVTGGRILDLAQLSLKPNESYECLWERLSNFVEDNLLKRSSGIKHLNTRVTVDEDISISLLNVTVVLWLRAINPDLPMMVKQRFATQLRDNTLYSLREDISESLQAILTEMQDREYTVNLARGYQKRSNSRFKPKSDSFRSQFSKAKQKRSKLCCLCDAAGRRGADTHFLSECTFLPAEDKRYISSIRDVVEDSDEDQESDEGSCCAINSIPSVSRVDVMSSPILGVKYKDQDAAITADTGGELNLIALEEALRLKLKMTKASQRACMCDGESGVRVLGEVNFDCTVTCRKTKHTLKFHGLVVKKLSCPILGGQPFLFFNDVFARTAKQMIYLGDCCEWRSLDKNATSSIRLCKAVILRNPTKTCLLPGDKLSISVPHEYKSQPIAVEPRHISKSVSSVPDWLPYQTIESSSEGHVEIVNSSSEPVLIRKHEQFAQIRLLKTNDEMPTQSAPPMNKPPKAKGPFSIDVQVDPSKILNLQQREKFKSINQEFDNVFSPELGKYNGVSGPFEHHINMGPTLPPQQKGRNPQYNRNNLEALQMKIDELVIRGVLVKPEDVGVQVEYVSPSFLVKKSNGGHRLVTAFNQLAEFVKPQPTAMPNVDDVLRHIAQFKVLIKTDLKDAYYLIQMGKSSMKYTGIVSPFRGTFLYQRAVMGLPGSEASLECLLSRILGDIMMRGSAVKLADDLYVGADTVEQLMNIWYEVLRLMELNGLRLSPAKTVICPTSTIILGWQWEEGTIRPTPHRLNTLSQCEPPETVHKLRSFIGSYKALSKVIPYHSDYLADFDKLCSSDKPATDKVPWSDDLINKFERAKLHLKDAKTITLPRREDELQIVTDASAKGIAAALYSIRDGKPVLSGLFNAKRQKHHMGWLPCELEALSITASVKHFSPYIIQSNHRVTVITDSLPCVSAYQKLSRGEFSMSPRVTTYLSTLSHYNIDVKHIAGVKNTVSDFASRNPIDCGGECQLCAFIESLEESVIRGVTVEEILSGAFSVPYTNRAAWRSLQQSCDDLKKVVSKLKSGSNPSRESGDVRKYLTARVKLSSRPADELLIVPSTEPLQPSRQRIVVPRGIVDGLLTALHLKLSHPSKSQLKLIFNRAYFSLSLDAAAARVTNGCHTCASLKKVPAMFIPQSTAPPPDYVGAKYSADVIKDNLQKILIVREYVSSYSDAVFIESENQEDLKEGLVKILSRMRSAGGPPVIVRVDPATPFVALTKDNLLLSLGIQLEVGEAKNINKNPVSERAVSEFREEFAKLQPAGGAINEITLAMAVSKLNSKIRGSKLTSMEMWNKRDMLTGEAITIDEQELIQGKQREREYNHLPSAQYRARGKVAHKQPSIRQGDLVFLYQDRVKSQCRDSYLVTKVYDDYVTVQKFKNNTLRCKRYKVKKEEVILVEKAQSVEESVQSHDTGQSSSSDSELSEFTITLRTPHPVEREDNEESITEPNEEGSSTADVEDSISETNEPIADQEYSECHICNKEVRDGEKALQCDICELWFHSSCCGMSERRYETLKEEGRDEPWACPAHGVPGAPGLRSQDRREKILRSQPRKGRPPGFIVQQSP